jgi:hypothetical protein
MREYLPTSILPHLPRSKTDLDPLDSTTLLGHIALLRELYIPPIHGGFQASDVGYDEPVQVERRSKVRARRFSASLADTMDSLGLGLNIDVDLANGAGLAASAIVEEDAEDDLNGGVSDGDEEGDVELNGDEEDEDGEERGTGHLDQFEREWAEKWLNGVVRRAQGWIEEHEEPEEEAEQRRLKTMEAILRDSTAVLAMMAGTSGTSSTPLETP